MDYKNLFLKLERTLDRIERSDNAMATLTKILASLVEDFNQDLGLTGGRIYVREDDRFVLKHEFPESLDHVGYEVPIDYPPVRELLKVGFVVHDADDPEVDHRIEGPLGIRTFAAVCVRHASQPIIAFSLKDTSNREHVVYTLNTIRHVVNLKLRKEHLEDRLAEARLIQMSLLPASAPEFAGFDLHGRTVPAEEVGGDLYDFLRVSERSLGIAVADAAGHGLPAALQSRDAIIGLRMGVEDSMRITSTIEKLNRVVSRSALSSRFITLFYGEIEPNGTLAYCNAGHNPPLLLRDGEFEELSEGGLVLGPNPSALYVRGYTQMTPGSILVAYSDGIVEAEETEDKEFGTGRLKTLMQSRRWSSAQELVDAIFAGVHAFSSTVPPTDDQTVVVVIRS